MFETGGGGSGLTLILSIPFSLSMLHPQEAVPHASWTGTGNWKGHRWGTY